MNRGDVFGHAQFPRRFVIITCEALNAVGTVVVAEVADEMPEGTRGMLAVPLVEADSMAGAVLTWRLNYMPGSRLGEHVGRLSAETMERVDMALRAALDL